MESKRIGFLGDAGVVIWHDIDPLGLDEFYGWHGPEHMPERINISGFNRGRRYRAILGDFQFFNLYEVSSFDALSGREYQHRLNNPTAGTVSAVRHFRRVSRSLGEVMFSAGNGGGGLLATWCSGHVVQNPRELFNPENTKLLTDLLRNVNFCGVHFLLSEATASAKGTKEEALRETKNVNPSWALLLEGCGETDHFLYEIENLCLRDFFSTVDDRSPPQFGVFQMQEIVTDICGSM